MPWPYYFGQALLTVKKNKFVMGQSEVYEFFKL